MSSSAAACPSSACPKRSSWPAPTPSSSSRWRSHCRDWARGTPLGWPVTRGYTRTSAAGVGTRVGRPFKVWEPFLFALELWLVVLGLASLFLYGGLFLDFHLHTAPVFATLGLGAAFFSSLVGGLLLVRRATE